jgi:hypothetical protein
MAIVAVVTFVVENLRYLVVFRNRADSNGPHMTERLTVRGIARFPISARNAGGLFPAKIFSFGLVPTVVALIITKYM